MLFIRLFLDDVGPENGGMELALGSHRFGRIASEQAETVAMSCVRETELARRGDVLVMQMLLLHRSLPSNQHRTRRVIRSDFANRPLPTPLQWAVSRR